MCAWGTTEDQVPGDGVIMKYEIHGEIPRQDIPGTVGNSMTFIWNGRKLIVQLHWRHCVK